MRRNWFWLLCSGLLAAGCNGPGPEETATTVRAAKPQQPAVSIQQVNVLVDLSGGMAGFVHPNAPGEPGSDFQRSITALLSEIQGQHQAAYYFVEQVQAADGSVLRPSTYDEMSHVISQGAKTYAKGTEMPEMLRQAARLQASQPGTINIIVSDFVYGPADQGQVWRVKTDVKDALATAKPMAVSVYAGSSAFRGNFYPGTRHPAQALHGAAVPYYVWVMGAPALVSQANHQLLNTLADRPQVHFNQATVAPPHGVLTGYAAQGNWFTEDGPDATTPGVVFSGLSKQEPAHFVVGLDLHELPPTARQQFTATALELDPANTDATLVRTWTADEPNTPKIPAAATKRGYTHFAQVALTRIKGGSQRAKLALRLPASGPALPDWVAAYSTANDDNLARQGAKTFRLTEVLQGVQAAFSRQPTAAAPVWEALVAVRLDE